jgi:putative tricarboxylic transport membrane protein
MSELVAQGIGNFSEAVGYVLGDPYVLAIIVAAAAYGVFMGAVPGLTATMAVALIVPITFFMDPIPALAAIVTLEACAIFAGDIPNTLLRIPGTPSSAAYADDAYALTRQGRSAQALGVCLTFSVAGGLFGTAVLMLFAPALAEITSLFTVAEYFWLYLLGLSCAVIVSRGSNLKATLALLVGLLLSTVGLSAVHTQARFTFGQAELFQGINFIPAMIGLFGVSEIFRNVLRRENRGETVAPSPSTDIRPTGGLWRRFAIRPITSVFGPALPLLWRRKWHALRSGTIGSLVGMLPGAGADIGAWVSLAASKRLSKKPEQYGSGSLEGIGDATAANNSALAGAWIPALVFGIPGDSVTAIVIGVLLMKNIKPGPDIFEKQGSLVYSIFLMFLLANLVLIPIGFLAIKTGGYVIRVPRRLLLPVILLFCVIGSYAINGSYFDVGVMLIMGILGFLLERREVPLGPVVLGIILGGPLEERFVQTLTGSGGDPSAFFGRPLAAGLGIVCILLWLTPVLLGIRRRWKGRRDPARKSG